MAAPALSADQGPAPLAAQAAAGASAQGMDLIDKGNAPGTQAEVQIDEQLCSKTGFGASFEGFSV